MTTSQTLSNGLKVVHIATESLVGWCGVVVDAGSRDDSTHAQGMAHFVEHTIFKGTTHRRAGHILNRMETVGGELNAYTTKENTVLYSVFPAQYTARAMELIADLVQNSVFPAEQLQREKDVVLEELAGYRDTPAEAVFDDFEALIFGENSAMGHNILGTEQHISGFTPSDCIAYLKSQYMPENMAFFYIGAERAGKVMRLAEKYFGGMHHTLHRPPRQVPEMRPAVQKEVCLDLHQAHTVVGCRVPGIFDQQRFALALLNNLIGGPGMNSLLNVLMRERRGLVYTIESAIMGFTDCGLLEIYFGCEHNKVQKSLDIISHTIGQLAENALSASRLEAAKRQYCGQLLVASQNVENVAFAAGKSLLYRGEATSIAHTIEHIKALSAEQLRATAEQLATTPKTVLTLY